MANGNSTSIAPLENCGYSLLTEIQNSASVLELNTVFPTHFGICTWMTMTQVSVHSSKDDLSAFSGCPLYAKDMYVCIFSYRGRSSRITHYASIHSFFLNLEIQQLNIVSNITEHLTNMSINIYSDAFYSVGTLVHFIVSES